MGTFIKNMLEVAHVLILLVSATHANWENIFSNQQNLQDYLTQPFSNSQGEYSTLSITENGQRVTQENILDRENNLMINIVPAHNGYDTAKYVFDGDSDFMMSVMYVEKSCTIQKNPVGKDIESTFRAFARNHVAYRSGGANMAKPVHVVKKPYKIIKGYMLKLFEIPLKFQPHCPPDFVAYTSHLIDVENPSMVNGNKSRMGDFYDFFPPTLIHPNMGRSPCVYSDGEGKNITWSNCSNRKFDCDKRTSGYQGCPTGAFNWNCIDRGDSSGCFFKLVPECYDENGLEKQGCLWHIINSNWKCDPCCETADCGGNLPQCVA